MTGNPEIMVYAHRHEDYAEILKSADQVIVDGRGLEFACLMKGYAMPRVTGVSIAQALCHKAASEGLRIGFIGGIDETTSTRALQLQQQHYPQLQGKAVWGSHVTIDGQLDELGKTQLQVLIDFDPHIVLVAFGHPRQEYVISRYKHLFPSLKTIVGVGGTFEFWTGKQKRAPVWMQKIGLEWLYRWYQEPERWKRMLTALIIFPAEVFLSKDS